MKKSENQILIWMNWLVSQITIPFSGVKEAITRDRLLILFSCGLILVGCANESVPQGGKQDTEPPIAKKFSPVNKCTQFKTDKITIIFNEFLKETGFSQVLISPPVDKRPTYRVEGRALIVKLKSPLRDSTTYTINFADDIKDLNESNPAPNFTYVFSTGTYIDSQKVAGNVILAKDNTTPENIVVALYPEDSLDGVQKAKPFYFSKTDKNGLFRIENIKAGKYRIYALKDQNYNYLYDQPNEQIAFADSILVLTDTMLKSVTLQLFEESKTKIRLDAVHTLAPGKLQISYNKPIHNFKLVADLFTENDFAYVNATNDTVIYWYSKYYEKYDTLYLSANDSLFDTVRMELKSMAKDSLFTKNSNYLSIDNQLFTSRKEEEKAPTLQVQELYKPLKINLSRPIIEINKTKALKVSRDSTEKFDLTEFKIDEKTKQSILFDFDKKEKSNYTIEIPDSTLKDIFGMWNKKLFYQVTTNGKENYGNLKITLKTDRTDKYYVIKLMNANNQIVKEFYFTGNGERKVAVDNILAGSYKFMVIDDTNKNGEWDTGDFKNKIQPEKIFTYKEAYQLKGGWDLEVEVKF